MPESVDAPEREDERVTTKQPTEEQMARDLEADLALCEGATYGPWVAFTDDGPYAGEVHSIAGAGATTPVLVTPEMDDRPDDIRFAAEAREGWPAAILRALAAERLLARTDWRECPGCRQPWPHPSLTSGLHCPACRFGTAEADVKRLTAELYRLAEQSGRRLAAVRKYLSAAGHALCHENRRELASAFGLEDEEATEDWPGLPPEGEFALRCIEYRQDLYGHPGPGSDAEAYEQEITRLKAELAGSRPPPWMPGTICGLALLAFLAGAVGASAVLLPFIH